MAAQQLPGGLSASTTYQTPPSTASQAAPASTTSSDSVHHALSPHTLARMPHRSLGVYSAAATVAPDVGISAHGVEGVCCGRAVESGATKVVRSVRQRFRYL